jgi:hypothetical protein
MRLSSEGLTLWYATPDAPAPPEEGASREGISLTIGVRPPNPGNAVTVPYRVDGKGASVVVATDAGTDYTRDVQYFRAHFPPFPEGCVVEYCPVLTCGGRQAPPPSAVARLPSRFTLADPRSPAAPPVQTPAAAHGMTGVPRFTPQLEFISSIHAAFGQSVDLIGETPIGLRLNYYLEGGTMIGPRLNGRVLPRGGDFLLICRDGVAAVNVQATFETEDGARLGAEYHGIVDLGKGGYERAVRGDLPRRTALQLAPRFMTGNPQYEWMNRAQFVAVGEVRSDQGTVDYDLFRVSNQIDDGES